MYNEKNRKYAVLGIVFSFLANVMTIAVIGNAQYGYFLTVIPAILQVIITVFIVIGKNSYFLCLFYFAYHCITFFKTTIINIKYSNFYIEEFYCPEEWIYYYILLKTICFLLLMTFFCLFILKKSQKKKILSSVLIVLYLLITLSSYGTTIIFNQTDILDYTGVALFSFMPLEFFFVALIFLNAGEVLYFKKTEAPNLFFASKKPKNKTISRKTPSSNAVIIEDDNDEPLTL